MTPRLAGGAGEARADTLQLLVFEVGYKRLALPAMQVREVFQAVAVGSLPRAPEIVEGAVNSRGQVIPVLDVRSRFGLPPEPISPRQHMIAAFSGGRLVVLRVDRIVELVSVAAGRVTAAAQALPEVELAAGVVALDDGVLVIHDLDRFLTGQEAAGLEQAIAGGAGS